MIALVAAACRPSLADRFAYRVDSGETARVEGRLAGQAQGLLAIETADGAYLLVPAAAVRSREPADGPAPLSFEAMETELRTEFGEDLVRTHHDGPFLAALVLAAPLPAQGESRVRTALQKAGRFLRSVERMFERYLKTIGVRPEDPRHPLVVLIFELDEDFNEHAQAAAGTGGLSTERVSGFYSALSNRLVIRMGECRDFEVPLHEAIHQQAANRGLVKRLAPVPVWFHEGLANSFQGSGERVQSGPERVHPRYAAQALAGTQIPWSEVIADDRAFQGDVLAGDAYTHAWCIHWLLATRYRDRYAEFVKALAALEPLEESDTDARVAEFETLFGKPVDELQREFGPALAAAARRERVELSGPPRGLAQVQMNLGEVAIKAVERAQLGGVIEAQGVLRNLSPIREMSFHVTVEAVSGRYAEWHVHDLAPNRTATLPPAHVIKPMRAARGGGPASAFSVQIRSALPDGENGRRWQRGELPVPE